MERNAARAPPQKKHVNIRVMPGATAAAATSRYGCWGRKRRDAHPGCGDSNSPPSPLRGTGIMNSYERQFNCRPEVLMESGDNVVLIKRCIDKSDVWPSPAAQPVSFPCPSHAMRTRAHPLVLTLLVPILPLPRSLSLAPPKPVYSPSQFENALESLELIQQNNPDLDTSPTGKLAEVIKLVKVHSCFKNVADLELFKQSVNVHFPPKDKNYAAVRKDMMILSTGESTGASCAHRPRRNHANRVEKWPSPSMLLLFFCFCDCCFCCCCCCCCCYCCPLFASHTSFLVSFLTRDRRRALKTQHSPPAHVVVS